PATPFLGGERLGALDILAAVVSKWSGSRKHLAQSRSAFHALLERIEADPVIARIFVRHWPAKP
ncbi:MAG TPA: glutathione S-transferase, partial [Casimicrobiaceae bacterium]